MTDGSVDMEGSKYAAEGCGREWESIDVYLTRVKGRRGFLVAARTSMVIDVGRDPVGQTERGSISREG